MMVLMTGVNHEGWDIYTPPFGQGKGGGPKDIPTGWSIGYAVKR